MNTHHLKKDFHLKEDIEKDRKQRLEAFGKRVWLTALSELNNPKVIEMQNKYENSWYRPRIRQSWYSYCRK